MKYIYNNWQSKKTVYIKHQNKYENLQNQIDNMISKLTLKSRCP